MLKNIIQDLINKTQQELINNPTKTFYGLYKDYSDCKGLIYNQDHNFYLVVTPSHTYANYLKDNGYTIYLKAENNRMMAYKEDEMK